MAKKYITAEKVGEQLNISARLVIKLYKEGRIPGLRISERKFRFNVSDIVNALNAENWNLPAEHEEEQEGQAQEAPMEEGASIV